MSEESELVEVESDGAGGGRIRAGGGGIGAGGAGIGAAGYGLDA
ncbi:Protein CBG26961 [Caenorhabditis briggsae]|uniref:Protein CBG26961 n=1 Tax=Caenorhabditis briggsae TaxID=6238 RepID=B6IHV4_CAEBR|nr:Protein CBG26961 [Caenorhabditis briggsae]CAR99484.1 Protein CBG26961 [Caenorhabditis briggsae]